MTIRISGASLWQEKKISGADLSDIDFYGSDLKIQRSSTLTYLIVGSLNRT